MSQEPFKKIENLYTNSLNDYGANSQAVGWKTNESQMTRFDKLNSVIKDKSKIISINDYGCGYAAHLNQLVKNGYKVESYNGYDISEKMLSEAKIFLEKNKVNIKTNLLNSSDIITQADYTFVSGTFNVKFDIDENLWKEKIKEMLVKINQFSNLGFSFNLLSTYVDWKEPHLFYGDPSYWFDFSKINFSKYVSLFHDYELYEWTICVNK